MDLMNRASCGVADVDCNNGYCCPAGNTCDTQDGSPICRLSGNTFFDPTPAQPASGGGPDTNPSNPNVNINQSSSSSSTGLSGGAIAGIVIGVLAILSLLVALILFMVWRRRRASRRVQADAQVGPHATSPSTGAQIHPPAQDPERTAASQWSAEKTQLYSAGPDAQQQGQQLGPGINERATMAELSNGNSMMMQKEAGGPLLSAHPVYRQEMERPELDGQPIDPAHAVGSPDHRAELP